MRRILFEREAINRFRAFLCHFRHTRDVSKLAEVSLEYFFCHDDVFDRSWIRARVSAYTP